MGRISNIMVGADPEVFLMSQDGVYKSAIGLIGGTKKRPIKFKDMPGYGFQEDNVMVEFNIPPAVNPKDFSASFDTALDKIKDLIPHHLNIVIDASADFLPQELSHRKAKQFGCEPDINAWTGMQNIILSSAKKMTLRTGAGHIHIGYEDPNFESNSELIKAMDLFAGVPSVLMDKDKRRKILYGKAGAYRNKPYGVEYRVLSNFWIANEELRSWAFRSVQKAVNFVNGNNDISQLERFITEAINSADEKLATMLVKDYQLEVL